ncbi:TlpA family protein disulfide reductase [bacterium]|nr:TlpA family protein disulfide reductase [bacterium]MCI0606508.1 TlpA family protein disulfide reductase [bacterium]
MITNKMLWPVLGLLIAMTAIFSCVYADNPDCCNGSSSQAQTGKKCDEDCTKTVDECSQSISASDQAKVMKTMSYYCSAYQACSVDRDLRGATAAELEEYKKEKALDGKTFTDRIAPDFRAAGSDGSVVSLSAFRGKPVALVFLAVHCNHSKDTLPILSELKKEYEPQGIVILPVYVHDGAVEDIKQFADSLKLDFPLLVVGKEISKAYKNRMVPTTLLIDSSGHIVRQFVGFKKQSVLASAFAQLLQTNEPKQTSTGR